MEDHDEYVLEKLKELRDSMFHLLAEQDTEKRHSKMDDLLIQALMILTPHYEQTIEENEIALTVLDICRAFRATPKGYS